MYNIRRRTRRSYKVRKKERPLSSYENKIYLDFALKVLRRNCCPVFLLLLLLFLLLTLVAKGVRQSGGDVAPHTHTQKGGQTPEEQKTRGLKLVALAWPRPPVLTPDMNSSISLIPRPTPSFFFAVVAINKSLLGGCA